jgi:hypothetical protein
MYVKGYDSYVLLCSMDMGGMWFGIGQMDEWIRQLPKEPNAWIHFSILHK